MSSTSTSQSDFTTTTRYEIKPLEADYTLFEEVSMNTGGGTLPALQPPWLLTLYFLLCSVVLRVQLDEVIGARILATSKSASVT